MLNLGFKETDQKEIKLPGKRSQHIVQFLRCIYPDKMNIVTEYTVHEILPLAYEYKVQPLLYRCKEVLLQVIKQHHRKGNVKEIYRNIVFADKYNLTELRKKLIYLASEYKLEDLNEAVEKENISLDIQNQVKDLTLNKYELNREDDSYLCHAEMKSFCVAVPGMYECGKPHPKLTAIRLLYRYCPRDEELRTRTKYLRNEIQSENKSNWEREIDLLPEAVKDMMII